MFVQFKTEQRGYTLTLEPDLFGAFVIVRRWYGLANRRGGMKRQVFLDETDALREFRRVQQMRTRHGYHRLNG